MSTHPFSAWQSPHDEAGRPMHWDAHHGKWVSSDAPLPPSAAANDQPLSPNGPRKQRAMSPSRASINNGGAHHNNSTVAARKRAAPPIDDTASTPVDDPDLPGWLVLQRTTNTGRSYKVYHGPNGEYAESKRQAVLLASGKPLDAAQLAFKSKPAPRGGGGGAYMGGGASSVSSSHATADWDGFRMRHDQRRWPTRDASSYGPTSALQRSFHSCYGCPAARARASSNS